MKIIFSVFIYVFVRHTLACFMSFTVLTGLIGFRLDSKTRVTEM